MKRILSIFLLLLLASTSVFAGIDDKKKKKGKKKSTVHAKKYKTTHKHVAVAKVAVKGDTPLFIRPTFYN